MTIYRHEIDTDLIRQFDISTSSTGSFSFTLRTRTFQFGKYEITVILGPNNDFMGISEIRLNRDFASHKNKMTPQGFHDVDDYYRE